MNPMLTEFTRRGGWGVRSQQCNIIAAVAFQLARSCRRKSSFSIVFPSPPNPLSQKFGQRFIKWRTGRDPNFQERGSQYSSLVLTVLRAESKRAEDRSLPSAAGARQHRLLWSAKEIHSWENSCQARHCLLTAAVGRKPSGNRNPRARRRARRSIFQRRASQIVWVGVACPDSQLWPAAPQTSPVELINSKPQYLS